MFLQNYAYFIVAFFGTLFIVAIIGILIFKIKSNDAPFFPEEQNAEVFKDMNAKLEHICVSLGSLSSTPHFHRYSEFMDELLAVMKDGRHCIVSNYEELGCRLDFICDVLAETPAGKRVIAEHPELLEEPKEEREENPGEV